MASLPWSGVELAGASRGAGAQGCVYVCEVFEFWFLNFEFRILNFQSRISATLPRISKVNNSTMMNAKGA